MATEVSILIKGKDLASDAFNKVKQTGGSAAKFLQDNWGKIAATAGVAGAAIEAMARKASAQNEALQKAGVVTGQTSESLRQLALDVSNVTFPLESAVGLFRLAGEQGIKTQEQLKEFAVFWDMVGDATGENAEELAKAGVALRGMGVAAGEEKEALSAFGFIMNNTTLSVGEFLTFLDRAGPELREMKLSVDDTAAIIGILTNELGMSARTARSEFTVAVSESKGNINELFKILGVTSDQFEKYRNKVSESSNAIKESSDIHAESYTTLQKLQHWLSEVMFQHGELLQVAGQLAPVLLGVSAGLTAIATIGPVVKSALIAVNTQLGLTQTLSAATATSLGLISTALLVVGAAVAGWQIGTYLAEKFDIVRQLGISLAGGFLKVWEYIKAGAIVTGLAIKTAFLTVGDWITEFLSGIAEKAGKVLAFFGLDAMSEKAQALADSLKGVVGETESFGEASDKVWKNMRENISDIETAAAEMWERPKEKAVEAEEAITESANNLSQGTQDALKEIPWTAEEAWNQVMATWNPDEAYPPGYNTIGEFSLGMMDAQPEVVGAIEATMGNVSGGLEGFDAYGIGKAKGGEMARGLAEGAAAGAAAGFAGPTGEAEEVEMTRAELIGGITKSLGPTIAASVSRTYEDFVARTRAMAGFQEGGVATRPVAGVFGEAGPEALIPLDKYDLGGKTIINNINYYFQGPLSGSESDMRFFAREILRFINQEQARS